MSFSRELQDSRQKEAREQILKLGTDKAETLVALVKGINSPYEKDRQWVSGKIGQYLPMDIYRYSCQTDVRFKKLSELFKTFVEADKYTHHKAWAAELDKTSRCIGKIPAQDGKQYYNVFNQFVGSGLLKKSKESKDTVASSILLDSACDEHHYFFALLERCQRNADTIKESKSDSNATFASGQLYNDLIKLGKVYWTPGYLYGAKILLELGENLIATHRVALGTSFREDAARYFFVGKRLAQPAQLENPVDLDHPEDPAEVSALQDNFDMIHALYGSEEFPWKLTEAEFIKNMDGKKMKEIRNKVQETMPDVINEIKFRKNQQREQKK